MSRRARAVLEHPLLGTDPRRTAVGIGYVAVVVLLVLASGSRGVLLAFGVERLPGVVDQLAKTTVFFAVTSTFVLSFAYALWNGGPVLAVVIPLVAPLSGALVARSIAMDVDLALALAAAGLAGTIAVLRPSVRRGSGWRPTPYPGIVDGAVVASVPAALAAVGTYRLAPVAGPHANAGVLVASGITVLALVGLRFVWIVCRRAVR